MFIALAVIVSLAFVVLMITFWFSEYDKKHLNTAQKEYFIEEEDSFRKYSANYYKLITEKSVKKWSEVENTKNKRNLEKTSGIYGLFIIRENIYEIIPVYVGQAENIFKRLKQHQNELRKIIKGEKNTRTYKKIVAFLERYNLKLQDINFVVLKKCSKEQLNEMEKQYIRIFGSDVYGFNQTKGNK